MWHLASQAGFWTKSEPRLFIIIFRGIYYSKRPRTHAGHDIEKHLCRLLSVLNVSNSIIDSTAVSWEVEQLFYSKCPKKIQMLLSFSKRVLVHFLVTRVDGTHHVTQCIRHKNFFFHFYSCQHHHRHSKCLCSSLFKCILPAVCVSHHFFPLLLV